MKQLQIFRHDEQQFLAKCNSKHANAFVEVVSWLMEQGGRVFMESGIASVVLSTAGFRVVVETDADVSWDWAVLDNGMLVIGKEGTVEARQVEIEVAIALLFNSYSFV